MEKYFLKILILKRIYSLIVWIMFGLFGAFFIIFSVNGKTKFIFFCSCNVVDSLYDVFYNGIEKLFNTVIFLYYLMVVPVFKTNDRLYTDKEFCYI